MNLAKNMREIIQWYPFTDMSTVTKGFINRLAERADDLEEELTLYRQMFEAMNRAGLMGAKHLAKFRYEKEQRSGPDQGEQIMLTVNGKRWRCPDCGSNVMTKTGENHYICNGCQSTWTGE